MPSAVVPVSHLFASPPIPETDDDRPAPDQARQFAPTGTAGSIYDHAPRRLPLTDTLRARQIEELGPVPDASQTLAPTPQLPSPPQADPQYGLPSEHDANVDDPMIRRLPPIDAAADSQEPDSANGKPSDVQPGDTQPGDAIRRLPPIEQEVATGELSPSPAMPSPTLAGTHLPADNESAFPALEGPTLAAPIAPDSALQQPTDSVLPQDEAVVAAKRADNAERAEDAGLAQDNELADDTEAGPWYVTEETEQPVADSEPDLSPDGEQVETIKQEIAAIEQEVAAESLSIAATQAASTFNSEDHSIRRLPPIDPWPTLSDQSLQPTDSQHARGNAFFAGMETGARDKAQVESKSPWSEASTTSPATDMAASDTTVNVNAFPADASSTDHAVPSAEYVAAPLGGPGDHGPVDPWQPAPAGPTPSVWTPVSVPIASLDASPGATPSLRDTTFAVIDQRVRMLAHKAEGLASRGAYYAARADMIKALRVITQALDTQRGGTQHSDALARAMRAFEEAGDFAPRGSQLEGELNLAQIVGGHRTPILKDIDIDHMAPLIAQQKYLEYAQAQFAESCDDLPSGSFALYGLARIYTILEHAKMDSQVLCLPKAVTLHQAALLVDPNNAKAANELGVLLARFGQLDDARRVLQHALSISSEPEIWMNLAVVHQRLGQLGLAHQAREQGTLMAARQAPAAQQGNAAVRWVDPKTFSEVRPAPGQ